MKVQARREKLLDILQNSAAPVPGDTLSKKLEVSRQIIVQDVAVLRAANHHILSTHSGYMLYPASARTFSREWTVSHSTEQILDELYCIVDRGGYVRNVMVEHDVYGHIMAELNIGSRREADVFVQKVKNSQSVPLKMLCGDVHTHRVEAVSEEILNDIQSVLSSRGYLISSK